MSTLVAVSVGFVLAAVRGVPWLRGHDEGAAVAFVAAGIMVALIFVAGGIGFHVHRQAARRDPGLRDPEEVYTPEILEPRFPAGHRFAIVAGYFSIFTLLGALFALPAGILGAVASRSGSLELLSGGVLCTVLSAILLRAAARRMKG